MLLALLNFYIQKRFTFILISLEITFCNFWDAFVSSRIVPPIGFELSSGAELGSVQVPRVSGSGTRQHQYWWGPQLDHQSFSMHLTLTFIR